VVTPADLSSLLARVLPPETDAGAPPAPAPAPASVAVPVRAMLLCAAHPDLSDTRGAAAALTLFRRLQKRPDVEPVLVAARRFASLADATGVSIHKGRRDEFIASVPAIDPLTLCSRNAAERDLVLADLLDHVQPDVVHLLDLDGFGLDAVDLLAERGVPIVLTLLGDLAASGASPFAATAADAKTRFARARLIGSYLARVDATLAADAFLAERLMDGSEVSSLQVVVGPNRLGADPEAVAMLGEGGGPAEATSAVVGLLKGRRAPRPIRLGILLSSDRDADLAFWNEARAQLPKPQRERFASTFYAEGGAPPAHPDAIAPQPIADAAALRQTVGALDHLLVFSRTEGLALEAVAEAISLNVPFLHPGRAEVGANDALGATVFDPDAPSHLAHCLLLLAKAARQQRILQHRAREAENAEALDTYAGFYHQRREARDGR
jgi:hypothetical protein